LGVINHLEHESVACLATNDCQDDEQLIALVAMVFA